MRCQYECDLQRDETQTGYYEKGQEKSNSMTTL